MPELVERLQRKLGKSDILQSWAVNNPITDVSDSPELVGSMLYFHRQTSRAILIRDHELLVAPTAPFSPEDTEGLNNFMRVVVELMGVDPVKPMEPFVYCDYRGIRSLNPSKNSLTLGTARFAETVDQEVVKISGRSKRKSPLLQEAGRPHSWSKELTLDYRSAVTLRVYPDIRPARLAANLLVESQSEGNNVDPMKLRRLLTHLRPTEVMQLIQGKNPFTPRRFHTEAS